MTTARDRPPEEAAEDSSFARGLRVLLTVADRGDVRADELSTLLDTPMSTIYRYLRTLAEFGFVDRHEAGYRLGPRLVIGGGATVTSDVLIRISGPVLEMLAQETGETAVVGRRVGLAAVSLQEVQSRHPLRVTMEAGTATPLNRGALGKVLLAYAPPEILEEVLAQEPSLRGGSGAEARRLKRDLREIGADGIARTEGEPVSGSVAIAVPVLREDGIVGAIGVIGPDDRCGLTWRARVSRVLPDAARTIVGALASGPESSSR